MKSNAIMFCAYDSSNAVGGPLVWVERLLPDLVQRGLEIHPILLHWDSIDSCVVQQALRDAGLPVRSMKLDNSVTIQRRVRWLIDQAIQLQPSVFVANHVVPAFFAAQHLQRFGVKTVGVIHSDDAFYEAIVQRFYGHSIHSTPDIVVPVSRLLEQKLAGKISEETRIARIPCGSPIPPVVSEEKHKGDPLRVMYAGRIVQEQKRILNLADAFMAAAQQVPGTEYSIFGDGPEHQTVVEKLSNIMHTRVKFHGPVPSYVLLQKMQEFDAFVLMSDYEGLPIALVEAMGNGLVPICYDFGSGCRELIQDGVNGIIIEDRGHSFIAAIRELAENPTLRMSLAANARTTVEQDYSSSANHGRWAELIKNLDQEAASNVNQIRQPTRLKLPPIEPRFRGEDWNDPTRVQMICRTLQRILSEIGRRFRPRKRLGKLWQKLSGKLSK